MRTRVLLGVLLLGLSIASASCGETSRDALPETASPVSKDLNKAVSIAVAALGDRTENPEDSIAVGARQEILNGKYVWIVTFKLARLLPADPSSSEIVGLGGETYATVDLETETATLRGGD